MTLLGRRDECELLDRVLSGARAGQGGSLVLQGEPGIGKSTLMDYAIHAASGFRVLRSVGSETEKELPYAALQQLCSAGLADLEQLPVPQRDALLVAFGHLAGAAPDRLLVGLALLTLLSQVARERPVLCSIDDSQWIDRESARAFSFAARRLESERIAFVFGARTVPKELIGLPELLVEGLGAVDALALLRSELPGRVDEAVLERIVAETHGNPLALLELPRGLTPAQLAGGFALPVSVPMEGRIEASFRRRIHKLPPASQRLVLLAAAEPTGDPVLVWRAAERLDIDESAAAAVEAEGLLEMSPRVLFRHPLVRSAVYGAASPEDRRQVHRELAEATDVDVDPDRRAWHLAQAAWRPDDDLARDLELSAERAQARGGVAAAAAFMERAAELTVDPKLRVARALAAAEAKRQAGALDAATALVRSAERGPLTEIQRAEIDVLRAQVSFGSERGSEAPLLLLRAAQQLEPHDVRRARETYLDAITAALFAGRLGSGGSAREPARAVLNAMQQLGPISASDLLLQGLALLIAEGPRAGTPISKRALAAFRGDAVTTTERLRWSWLAGRAACFIWDYDTWDALTARQIEMARASGTLAVLPLTLSTSAGVRLFAGQLSEAESLVEQVETVADATDTQTARYAAVLVAAFRGREQEAQKLIDASARDFVARGEGMGISLARSAAASLFNGLARYDEAFAAAEDALEVPYELWYWPWATVELIEAASRTGRAAPARSALERLTESTSTSGTPWAAAIEDRSRALLSEGDVAETLYRNAIDQLTSTKLRLDLARTRLVYGEWLRRESRPADAREQLRRAHELFTEFGCEGFAERARIELRATGERARKRTPDTANDLTPQEAQIAQLVAQGATNVEISAQLFISPSTVEYHLHKVFRKVGIRSRTQLARWVLESTQAGGVDP